MTHKEAIQFLEKNIENHREMAKLSVTDEARNSHAKSIEMYKMTIEALKKQVPKEPEIFPYKSEKIKEVMHRDVGFFCPVCGIDVYPVFESGYDYCPGCGQRLSWEEIK